MKKEIAKTCSYEQLSVETGIPKGTLYSMVSKKQIPHYRLGRRHILFDRREVGTWLAQLKVEAKGVNK